MWAAAGAYGFEPLFLARNTDGTIDFYMNCVVGLVHKYYGDDLLRDLFATWDGDLRESQLDDLTWLYLEGAVYLLELPRRPVLSELRRAHADYFFGIQYKLSRQEWMAKNQLVYTMQADRWRTVQGRHPPVMTPYESRLAEALSPAQPPQPGQLKGELLGLFARFALFDGKIRHKVGLHLHLEGLLASLATKTLPTQMIKTDRLTVEHSGSVEAGGSGPTADKRLAHITLRQNAAEDRAYIESCFGRSLYPPERLRKAEQALCTGAHLGCRLWFASGVPSPEQAPTPEAKHLAEQAQLQADRNRAYYAKNRALHRSVVLRLTEQIRNCILVHQQPNARIARSGALDPERVWRAPLLRISPPSPWTCCWTLRLPGSTVRRSLRRRARSWPRALPPAASRCGSAASAACGAIRFCGCSRASRTKACRGSTSILHRAGTATALPCGRQVIWSALTPAPHPGICSSC